MQKHDIKQEKSRKSPGERLDKAVTYFGVRHLSPAASFHLLKLLESKRPKCVLIEGPSDANDIIRELAAKGVEPPVAILSYTTERPVDSILYPFAEYSPEYQAVKWAVKNKAEVRFIDLPTGVTLFNKQRDSEKIESSENPENSEPDDSEDENADEDNKQDYYNLVSSVYNQVAEIGGGVDYDDYWERNFEHNLNDNVCLNAVKCHSAELRKILEPKEQELYPQAFANNALREQFMKREINRAATEYDNIVVVTGAYHSEAIASDECVALTDKQADDLKNKQSRPVKLTLMPYTYYRLSARSGYGAGNKAPNYFQLMWEHIKADRLHEFPHSYVAGICRTLRESGANASTASVIEAVRLSQALASLKSGFMPSLRDLHDALINTVGEGDSALVVKAFAEHDIGTRFGFLPEGVSQTPIQDDINRELKRLKIEKYKSTVAQTITLDLRENTRVSSSEAAFADLNRSTFFNRLALLGIGFAVRLNDKQESASWRENWELQWSPEVEIAAVETVLKGETIEVAAAYQIKESLESESESVTLSQTARLIKAAYKCDLPECFALAANALQAISSETENFSETASAAWELSEMLQYGDLRKTDTAPLKPLLKQLFLHASLLLNENAGCDDKAAKIICTAMNTMHVISQQCTLDESAESDGGLDDENWVKELTKLAFRDDKNAILSGLSFAILLERNIIDDEQCTVEVSRRLSAGIPPDIGAGWFEGLSARNRYSLLSRVGIWRCLNDYVALLDEDEFRRSLVFLRRAFADFEAREKNSIAELLGEFWGMDSGDAAIALGEELTEEESETLEGLNDFDFDF
jgi:hypothetical protein